MKVKIEGSKVLSEAPACYSGPNAVIDEHGTKWVEVATVLGLSSSNPGIEFKGAFGALLVARVAEAVLAVAAERLEREEKERNRLN